MKTTANQTSTITYNRLTFLVFDAPTNTNIPLYIKDMLQLGLTDVVRVCDPTYDKSVLEAEGIRVHDWAYPDGDSPPLSVVNLWLDLIAERLKSGDVKIGVHCVAGLGRAPALVSIALIEQGMAALDSIAFIRERRRGAINAKQMKFLEGYKKRTGRRDKGCALM